MKPCAISPPTSHVFFLELVNWTGGHKLGPILRGESNNANLYGNFDLFSQKSKGIVWVGHMDVSKNGGTQQPWVFLLKMIILGCFGGTPIFGNTHMMTLVGGTKFWFALPWNATTLPSTKITPRLRWAFRWRWTPDPVLSRVITPLIGVITPVTHL